MAATKILVTGGAGFIGSALVKQLIRERAGHRILIIDNFSTGRLENLRSVSSDVEIRNGDILDQKAMTRYCQGREIVFHLAAIASVERSIRDPVHTYEVNVEGTHKMLIAAKAAGVELVIFASSAAIYGEAELFPTPETEKPRPCSPYAMQKMQGESIASRCAESGGPRVACLRFFNVYGPGQRSTSGYSGVLSAFCKALALRDGPVIFGDGEQSRDFIFIDDVVRAMIEVARYGKELVAVYNVGTGKCHTINALWDRMQELTGTRLLPRYLPARAGDISHSQAQTAKIEQLGFRVRTDLGSGLSRLISWYTLEHSKRRQRLGDGYIERSADVRPGI
jgi:nucleoside-diphosphate-sugar epimerase